MFQSCGRMMDGLGMVTRSSLFFFFPFWWQRQHGGAACAGYFPPPGGAPPLRSEGRNPIPWLEQEFLSVNFSLFPPPGRGGPQAVKKRVRALGLGGNFPAHFFLHLIGFWFQTWRPGRAYAPGPEMGCEIRVLAQGSFSPQVTLAVGREYAQAGGGKKLVRGLCKAAQGLRRACARLTQSLRRACAELAQGAYA